ncbi:unnamed protein product [Sphagnum balticum]
MRRANYSSSRRNPKEQNCSPWYSVEHSIVGVWSPIEEGVTLKDTMMLGADYYEMELEIAVLLTERKLPVGIGKNSKISNCIVDKNARISNDVVICNTDSMQEAAKPEEGFYIRTGVTIICKNIIIKAGTVI